MNYFKCVNAHDKEHKITSTKTLLQGHRNWRRLYTWGVSETLKTVVLFQNLTNTLELEVFNIIYILVYH